MTTSGEIYDIKYLKLLLDICGFKKSEYFQSSSKNYITDLYQKLKNGHTVTISLNLNTDHSPAIGDKLGKRTHWVTAYGYLNIQNLLYIIISQYGKYFLFNADNLKKSNDNLIGIKNPNFGTKKVKGEWITINEEKSNYITKYKSRNKKIIREFIIKDFKEFHHTMLTVPYSSENLFNKINSELEIKDFENESKNNCNNQSFIESKEIDKNIKLMQKRKVLFEFDSNIIMIANELKSNPEIMNYKKYNRKKLINCIFSSENNEKIFIKYLERSPDKKNLLNIDNNILNRMICLNKSGLNKALINYIGNKSNKLTPPEKNTIFITGIKNGNKEITNYLKGKIDISSISLGDYLTGLERAISDSWNEITIYLIKRSQKICNNHKNRLMLIAMTSPNKVIINTLADTFGITDKQKIVRDIINIINIISLKGDSNNINLIDSDNLYELWDILNDFIKEKTLTIKSLLKKITKIRNDHNNDGSKKLKFLLNTHCSIFDKIQKLDSLNNLDVTNLNIDTLEASTLIAYVIRKVTELNRLCKEDDNISNIIKVDNNSISDTINTDDNSSSLEFKNSV